MILTFDFNSETPLFMQLRDQVVIAIARGELKAGEHLPTVRALSTESGINAMTVSKAYQLLKKEGYITTERRGGAVVSHEKARSGPSGETLHNLRIAMSELRLAGVSLSEAIRICTEYYEGDENQ